jgi:dTDP-4-dehydrorhamnose reductase
LPSVRITAAPSWAPFEASPGLLEIRTGDVFVPWDHSARPVQMLEALERGDPVRADAGKQWSQVYGPDVVDLALDLLIDAMTGTVGAAGERMNELSFARSLAMIAECDSALVVPTLSHAEPPLFDWGNGVAWLPPVESSLERFVREARTVRRIGDLGVDRRNDEPHMQQASTPAFERSELSRFG